MKLIYALVFVLLLNNVHAQQVFQGSITYTVHAPQEKNAELLILYGPNKIKLKFKEKEDYDKTYLIVDLDSAKFYTVNTDSKTFQSKKLAEITTDQPAMPKTIAGYTTNPIKVNGSAGFTAILGFAGSSTFFAAPDLYFPIPKKHTGIPELIMIQNNHIVLGAEIKMGIPTIGNEEMPADSIANQMKVSIEATKVTPQNIDIAEFFIPKDFTLQKKNYYSMTDTAYATDSTANLMYDTTMLMADTLAVPPPPKKKTSTTSKPSTPKKTTATKTEAIKPKKTQTKS